MIAWKVPTMDISFHRLGVGREVAFTLALAALFPLLASAARTSANYSIPVDSTDAGGSSAQSASYALKGSAAGEFGSGQSAVTTSAGYSCKNGFVGELYDIVSLSVTAPPSNNLNEAASRQLVAAPLADDSTTVAPLNPSAVAWSIASGPITSVTAAGVATAGNVYQDTPATLAGTAQGLSGQLVLNILNVTTDDFGAYAGDGIDDSWQVQYFGQPPNALAGPNADPDGDGQNNLFEFTAGLVPNDPNSRLVLSIQPVAGHPGQKSIVFNPVVSGRTYAVQFRTNLVTGAWSPLTGTTQSDNGSTRTVTDPNATGPKDYRVQVTKP
jgi:hypothetical protein